MRTEAKTREQIAREYNISSKTLKKWLDKENIVLPRCLINPKNINKIYETFGIPNNSKVGRQFPNISKKKQQIAL